MSTNNAILAHQLGLNNANGTFTGYDRANNLRVAGLFTDQVRQMGKLSAPQTTTGVVKGLFPAVSTTISPQRPLSLSNQSRQFLADYRDHMLQLQTLASRATADASAERLEAGATDPDVAAVKGRLSKMGDTFSLTVEQVAGGQTQRSAPLAADEPLPTMSGALRIESEKGSADVFVSAAGLEDNRAMLEHFAAAINAKDTGVTASVVEGLSAATAERPAQKTVSLQLEAAPGEENRFAVKGTLASRLQFAQTVAPGEQKAVYTLQKNDEEPQRHTADTNTVKLDKNLTATLKAPGKTTVTAAAGAAQQTADRLQRLVEGFNETAQFLNKSGERSTGARRQLQRMATPPSEQKRVDLQKIGIETQRDGTLSFDRQTYLQAAASAPARTQSVVEEFTQRIRDDAQSGMREPSGSLVTPTAQQKSQQFFDQEKAPVNVLSTYTRNSVLNVMNMYAAGVLINLNI